MYDLILVTVSVILGYPFCRHDAHATVMFLSHRASQQVRNCLEDLKPACFLLTRLQIERFLLPLDQVCNDTLLSQISPCLPNPAVVVDLHDCIDVFHVAVETLTSTNLTEYEVIACG